MENNVVELFPKADNSQPTSPETDPAAAAQERTRREADSVRARLSRLLTQEEASFFARSLGRLIEQSGRRRTNKHFMAKLSKEVGHSTFDKQRKRYIQFEDESSKAARGGGDVFLRIAEKLAVWDNPDDRDLATNRVLADLGIGLPQASTPTASVEAFVKLSHLLKMEVGKISRDLDLAGYFRFLTVSNLEVRHGNEFYRRETQYGFSINRIFDKCEMFEVDALIPSFLPRVRIATLYRRHVSTNKYISDPAISSDEIRSVELLYLNGLRHLGLEPNPDAGGAYPSAPSGWEKLNPDGLSWVYERLDVWLVITPDGTTEHIRPALIFACGESVLPDGDAWESYENFCRYINTGIYYDSAAEGDDPNCSSDWPKSSSSRHIEPSAAAFYQDGIDKHYYGSHLTKPNVHETSSTLEVRVQVPLLGRDEWPSAYDGPLLKFFDEQSSAMLFQQCFFYNDCENDYSYATYRPSALNDTPILIRRFLDSEVWSPAPMKSVGGFLLRGLLETENGCMLSELRKSGNSLIEAMASFNTVGSKEFERRYDATTSLTDQTLEEKH